MQPLTIAFAPTVLEQIRRAKHRTSRKMTRIHRHYPGILVELVAKVLGHGFGMLEVVVYADEGAGDVGLLIQVRKTEAGQCRCVVEDGGLILGAEAGGECVAGLGRGSVYAVDEGWDGGGSR
jgi:hypothetical protein